MYLSFAVSVLYLYFFVASAVRDLRFSFSALTMANSCCSWWKARPVTAPEPSTIDPVDTVAITHAHGLTLDSLRAN